MNENDDVIHKLKYLGLTYLQENMDDLLKTSSKKRISLRRFLNEIIDNEYSIKKEKARCNRLKSAKIPSPYVLDTFPFSKQPKLRKRLVMDAYDSLEFVNKNQFLVFIGPTGCGKTGLATSFLSHAINNSYKGFFVTFDDLLRKLHTSRADFSEEKIIKKFKSFDVLLIDEFGYSIPGKEEVAMLFEIIKGRAGQRATIITSQLGFDEWNTSLQNGHLTAALIDRITTDCIVFNMNKCVSIRPKKIIYATGSNK